MPNRIIKDTIHTSDTVNQMTDFQFRLWVNLITYVDDYGRGDARPAIIKGICFPLRDRLSNADISKALQDLAGMGCVTLYEVDGKPYLCFPTWESHQNIRNKKSRYPGPEDGNLQTIDINCNQLQSIASNCSRNPIQSESESESESESNPNINSDELIPRVSSAWNALGLSQITKISDSSPRGKMLKARIAEYGEDAIFNAIENIKRSSFLRGQNDRGWTITFDWFVKPTNFVKVLEGNYTDKTQTKTVETRKGVAYGGELDSSVVRSAYERLLQEESA